MLYLVLFLSFSVQSLGLTHMQGVFLYLFYITAYAPGLCFAGESSILQFMLIKIPFCLQPYGGNLLL